MGAFSWWAPLCLASALSFCSVLSILSVASAGSFLSVASAGSILSISSVESILSINCVGGILQICNDKKLPRILNPPEPTSNPFPPQPFVAEANDKCLFGSCTEHTCALSGSELSLTGASGATYTYAVGSKDLAAVAASAYYTEASVHHSQSQLVQLQQDGGAYSTKTITERTALPAVPDSDFRSALGVGIDDLFNTFDYKQLFRLYAAELGTGTTKGWCRGGDRSAVAAYKADGRIVVVPTGQAIFGENKCNRMSALKPATVADCEPMRTCLANRACKALWRRQTAVRPPKCAYTTNEFTVLFSLPVVSVALVVFILNRRLRS